ncbi:sterile alpha motif domain-containing protein 14-like isoform X1 [Conger conger]|uniref:sterile alpha motif domain-containing protein 14-like isoform X1 n=1 Tax=Conger conger TaxID=82655 RepID=UPI002A598D68|nr:sterile alpha motif domain-containing protein 14-like isoform X1 [Conger conger]
MSASQAEENEHVFDLNEAIPETELLDSSLQKARAQLSVKARRHRPSRSRLRDSVSSTEGDESLERKSQDSYGSSLHSVRSPLHSTLRGSSPSPDSLLSSSSPVLRSPAFTFDTALVRRAPEESEAGSPVPRGRYKQLTNTSSQEALCSTPTSSPSKSCPSSEGSPLYIRQEQRPESDGHGEDDAHDRSLVEPDSPTVILDKKTKRRFHDLGVTLRRSYGKVRKEKSNRLSVGNREPSESPSRSSGPPFVPFSWFSDSARGSTSSCSTASFSPKGGTQSCSPRKSSSQESTLSDEVSPQSPRVSGGSVEESRSSHPYKTLSQSSDELLDEPLCLVSTWSTQQVCQWLKGLNMEQYIPEFTARDIDGEQLLQMDGSKLKGLGVSSSSDRSALKRRLKDMHAAAEKERKAQEKLEKQKEKQRKKDQEQRKS